MCFSAQASFITASALSIVSLLSIKKTHNKKLIPLAASPLFFVVQQACEGIVWLTLNAGDTTSTLHNFAMYSFLFFAGTWWPICIPIILYIPEKIHTRKKLLSYTFIIGIITAIILFFAWTLQITGVENVNHNLNYPVVNYPFGITNQNIACVFSWSISLAYCVATVTPLFISSIRYTWALGVAVSLGLIVSYIFYAMTFPSVWCFFAAVSSIIIYFIV